MDRENKAYKEVLKHRKNCKKWGKKFCLDCFGGGLNRFIENYGKETRRELGLLSAKEMAEQSVMTKILLDTLTMNDKEAIEYFKNLKEKIKDGI